MSDYNEIVKKQLDELDQHIRQAAHDALHLNDKKQRDSALKELSVFVSLRSLLLEVSAFRLANLGEHVEAGSAVYIDDSGKAMEVKR